MKKNWSNGVLEWWSDWVRIAILHHSNIPITPGSGCEAELGELQSSPVVRAILVRRTA